jgi:G3E family GTPase
LRQAVAPKAVITLVDPGHFLDPERRAHETYADQVLLADVLVANRCDQASEDLMERFRAAAAALYPPKVVVAETSFGALDPAWLDLDPAPTSRLQLPWAPDLVRIAPAPAQALGGGPPSAPGPGAAPYRDAVDGVEGFGWVWPASARFDRWALQEAMQRLVHPNPAATEGLLRVKGVFQTPRVTLLVQADPSQVRMEPLDWRRDSRVEVIAAAGTVSEDALCRALEEAILPSEPR